MSQRAAVAVEYERVFAAEAKKRQLANLVQNVTEDNPAVRETLPERSESSDYHASDQAGDLFNVSGRSVRDAKFVADNDPELAEQVKAGGEVGIE